ncbi:MAG: hypothetical protein AAF685_03185 [Cyanobacteria bacterium P01_C01_bin.89]
MKRTLKQSLRLPFARRIFVHKNRRVNAHSLGNRRAIAQAAALITLASPLLACGGGGEDVPVSTVAQVETMVLAESSPDPVGAPEAPESEVMVIVGKVIATAPLVDAGLYRIDDGTGTLWIRTDRLPLPAVGDSVRVELTAKYRPIEIESTNFDQAFGIERRRSPLED